jgi:hypothetical protein
VYQSSVAFLIGRVDFLKNSLTICCLVSLDVKYDCAYSTTLTREIRLNPRERGSFFLGGDIAVLAYVAISLPLAGFVSFYNGGGQLIVIVAMSSNPAYMTIPGPSKYFSGVSKNSSAAHG